MAVADQFETVQKLYIAFYQRPADFAGRQYWAEQVEAQGLSSVINAFATSAEATALYGEINSDTIGDVIDAIYQAAFGRAADADGKAWYIEQFNAGEFTAATIALNVVNGAAGDDATTLGNKVQASDLFTAAVENVEYNEADITAARDFLAGVTTTVPTQAEVQAVVDGQIAGTPGEVSELTQMLNDLQSAQDGVASFLEAWGEAQDPVDATPTAPEVFAAVETAENGVDTVIAGIETATGVSLSDYNVVETSVGTADQLEDARLNVVRTEVAAVATQLQTDVSDATKTLNDLNKSGLKAAVDAYVSAVANATVAADAVDPAGSDNLYTAADTAINVFEAGTGTTLNALPGNYVAGANDLGSGISYNTTTNVWTVPANLQSSPYLADLKATFASFVKGLQASENADDLVDVRLDSVASIDSTQVDPTAGTLATGSEAEAYASAVADLAEFNELVSDLDDAVAAVTAARADAVELTALQEAVAEQTAALEDAGYAVEVVNASDADTGTSADDIFMLSAFDAGQSATISDFGTLGDDQLFIGADYTFNAGALSEGNNSALEVFFVQNGVNTDVVFETATFGSNAASQEVFTVTLVGVNAADLSLSADGYITAA